MVIQRTERNFQGSFCSCLLCGSSFPRVSSFSQVHRHRSCEPHRIAAPLPKARPSRGSSMGKSISSPVPQLLHALLGSSTAALMCCVGQGVLQKPQHSWGGGPVAKMQQTGHGWGQTSLTHLLLSPSFSTCLMAKNDCFFSGYFLQF